MFLQPDEQRQIQQIVSETQKKEILANIMSILTSNSDSEEERGFKNTIWQEPNNPTHRLAYANWLGSNERNTEADLHRLIAQQPGMMRRLGKRPHEFFDVSSIKYLPNGNTYREIGKATPKEASRSANWLSNGVIQKNNDNKVQATHLADLALQHANNEDTKKAIENHYLAAMVHLQLANDPSHESALSQKEWRMVNHRAAHGHILAAEIHKINQH